jgi:hypothetical protein
MSKEKADQVVTTMAKGKVERQVFADFVKCSINSTRRPSLVASIMPFDVLSSCQKSGPDKTAPAMTRATSVCDL